MSKQDLLKKVLNEINTKVSDDIIVDFSKKESTSEVLGSWGSLLVDQICPLVHGKVYECYGPYSSGKSSLAISASANVVKEGGIAVYIDSECSFNVGFAEALGLDVTNKNFVLIQPDTEENALAVMIRICKSGAADLVVLDSTNALQPKAMFMEDSDNSEELGVQRVGLKAKILNNAVVQLVPLCKSSGTSCIFISQLRSNISLFGAPDKIGVGRALEFFASARLKVSRTGKIEGDLPDGTKGIIAIPVQVQTTKNKIIAPFRTVNIQINIEGENKGICVESEYTQVAFNLGILKKDNRGILFSENTPLYPNDTPLASSIDKLNEILGQIKDENDSFYWIKQEIELKVKKELKQISQEEIDKILNPIYEEKIKENKYAEKYLELANKSSNGSKILEANYYINKAYKYNPFDKSIFGKYKIISKRYNDKKDSIKKYIATLVNVEENKNFNFDFNTNSIVD